MKQDKIKLVVLDGYGVVFSRGYPDTVKALAKRVKLPEKILQEVIYNKYFNLAAERKITQKQAWRLTVKELALPVSWQELRDLHLGLLRINQPAFQLARKILRKYLTIILSKNTRSQFQATKKKFPLVWRSFDAMINTWELGLPKASQKTISLIAERFKVKPEEILYIDDQKANLVAPKKMGVKTIFYQNFNQFKKDLKLYLDL